MNTLKVLSDEDLLKRTREVARREQALTLEVIAHLEEISSRRLHAARGYSSLFEFCVKALSYSESAASQRVAAMRLIATVPDARERIERGELKLAAAAAVQRQIRREELVTGMPMAHEAKRELVLAISGKSTRETERILLQRALENGIGPADPCLERIRPVTLEHTEIKFVADQTLMAKINRVRELKGPVAVSEIVERALDALLDREDPVRRAPRRRPAHTRESRSHYARKATRYVPLAARHAVALRAGGQCEYVDTNTSRRCESRSRLQFDHIVPFARGGKSTVENLRQLCPTHNQWVADRCFGPDFMVRARAAGSALRADRKNANSTAQAPPGR